MSSTPPSGEPELLELGHQPQRRPRRGLVVGIVAGVVLALGLPLGAFAFLRLFGGGTQPHDVLPANAVAYLRLDLDPSAPQKIDALRFLRTFPAFEKYTRITDDRADVRQVIVDALLEDAPCDLGFEQDVAPWLGNRFGVAMMAPTATGNGEPAVVAAVQVSDEQAARKGLAQLRSCDPGIGATGGWSYLDGYMIVAETQEQATDFARVAERTPLADNEQFRSDMDRLGEQGVASLWFSGDGVYQAFSSMVMGDPGPAGGQFDLVRDQVRREIDQSYRSGAVAFRFDDRYLELATVLNGSAYREPSGGRVADMALPESTAVALGFANGAEYVDQQWDMLLDALAGGPVLTDPDRRTQLLERQTGLRLPADIKTLVGDSFTLALDGAHLDFRGLTQAGDPSLLDLGARSVTDTAAFTRVVETLEGSSARGGLPIDLVVQGTDDGAVVALNKEYAGRLAEGGSLTDTQVFTTAVPDADEAQGVFFVNVDLLEKPVLDLVPPMGAEVRETTDNVTKIEAIGVSASSHDGYSTGSLRITVAD
jgi:hypothetical protein